MQKEKLNIPLTVFLVSFLSGTVVFLPLYILFFTFSWKTLLVAVGVYVCSQLAITVGYHRFYSHRAFKARWIFEWPLLFFGTLAIQGSAMQWAHDHRLHHAFVDTPRDPYYIKRGFWYAHLTWMFYKTEKMNTRLVHDLNSRWLLRFQHEWFLPLALACNVLVVWGAFLITKDLAGSIYLVGAVRLWCTYNSTWAINSVTHTFGTQMYSTAHSARDNFFTAILTFGGGYHNYHHSYPTDYRDGVRWFDFDPGKWVVWFCSKLGLTYDLRRVTKEKIEIRGNGASRTASNDLR